MNKICALVKACHSPVYHVKEKKYLSIREIPLVKDLESKIEKAETTSLLSYLRYTVNSML